MLYYVSALVKAIIVVLAACFFFRVMEQKNEPNMGKKIICIGGSVMGLFFINFIPLNLLWLRVFAGVFSLVVAMFFYRGLAFQKTLYLTFFYFVFVLILGKFDYLIILLFPLVYILKKIAKRRPSMYALRHEWTAFGLIPLFTMAMLMWKIMEKAHFSQFDFVLLLVFGAGNIFLFYIFSDLITKQKLLVRERILKNALEQELAEYANINQALEQQRSRSHEFKNYINCIYYMIEMKRYEELGNFVHSVRSNMNAKDEAIYHTGNLLSDAIFNAKYKEALAAKIDFKIETDSLEGLWLKDEDVVVIFSNLLNNALEAAGQCTENKYIHMQIKRGAEGIHITAENSHSNVICSRGERLMTSKEDADFHGFGVENMRKAVAKYDGAVDISYTDNKFMVNIFLHSNC